MVESKEFDVIRVARSDGADTGPGYWPAATTAKKAGKEAAAAPRAKAQMVRLDEDDPRFVEWRVKLGILLKLELSPKPEDGNPWYVHFPRGYWLYEKSKHLWASGYPIKSKLFKTPQEFGIHLIWLLSASMDYRDCCCVHCNVHCNVPSQARIPSGHDSGPESAALSRAPMAPRKATPVPPPAAPGQLPPREAANVPGQAASKTTDSADLAAPAPTGSTAQAPPPVEPPAQAQAQSQAQSQVQTEAQSQPQPQPQPQAVKWDLQTPLLFRAGELVWYQNGNSWRLGVIAAPGNDSLPLIPIGHAAARQPSVTKACREMRPFHAFSVPGMMLPDLQNKTFDQVAWDDLFIAAGQDRARRNNLILDASKMAASKIDASYSPWCPLVDDANPETAPYYGCFFGAERIEVGDCVRVKPLAGNSGVAGDWSVLGLRSIVAPRGKPPTLLFRGNVYQLTKATDAAAVPPEDLPPALRDETLWRLRTSPGQPWRWVLASEDVLLDEKAVRGRFYPTHQLMPILNEASFSAAVADANIEGQYPFLNNRMDGPGGYIGLKANRRDMLGASVPQNAAIALEPLIRELPGNHAGGAPPASE